MQHSIDIKGMYSQFMRFCAKMGCPIFRIFLACLLWTKTPSEQGSTFMAHH